ncbi:MAG: dTDP-4-dehydrorhamnose 3,5-epimerase family protein [Bacteroidota bacterium]|nr:dTDP-4-dehydrorhamnose 3,5-epimerase family protein [Bacteroidota bacterium]
MQFIQQSIPDIILIKPVIHTDIRGSFMKVWHKDLYAEQGINVNWDECYHSRNVGGVIRGMHFQLPPHQHAKLVYCSAGKLLDVLVDLRKGSATFCRHFSIELSADTGDMLYIPAGFAHGFCTPYGTATMHYMVSTVYNQAADTGIRYDSINFNWPENCQILNARDLAFVSLSDFDSPF